LYHDANFRGGSITLEAGEQIEDLQFVRFSGGGPANDRISSIRVEGPAEVLVFRDANFRGGVLRLTHDEPNLGTIDRGWNDSISSIRVEFVRGEGRHGPGRPDLRRVDEIIVRAYRDVLLRNPDDAGLRSFRSHMIEDGWTEAQVRDALRHSEEYRSVVDRIVTKAYRDILGRDPDEGGRRTYTRLMLREGWTEEDVREGLRKSDEYRDRHRRNGG
jgi:hypothetical protein